MRLLLDAHILIWWLTGDRKLPKAIAGMIASEENDVAVSAAAILEIAIKRGLNLVDRMQIAQAIVDGRRLITRDQLILRYGGIAGFDPLPA